MVDFVVRGEGEEAFRALIEMLLAGKNGAEININGVAKRSIDNSIDEGIAVTVADLDSIAFPYDEADVENLKDRIIYYESSRGCPYACKYCLSCATRGVRYRSLDKVFAELKFFIDHDVRQVKFVDRTFNANKAHYLPILKFIAAQDCRTNFHFEIVAHHIDEEIKEVLKTMPKGRIQFEIGIQSTNLQTLGQISRANPWQEMTENIKSIMAYGNIHLHVDLIIGLPYEDLTSFAKSFNDVYLLQADMLQVGYGSMLLESLLAVLVIVVVGSLTSLSASGVLDANLSAMALADGATPFTKFSVGVTGLVPSTRKRLSPAVNRMVRRTPYTNGSAFRVSVVPAQRRSPSESSMVSQSPTVMTPRNSPLECSPPTVTVSPFNAPMRVIASSISVGSPTMPTESVISRLS